jgi:hypothetical protein
MRISPVAVSHDYAAGWGFLPKWARKCPAFYNPALLPAGYNSVSYCATVPAGGGFTLLTKPLSQQEQQSFLLAAQKVESYVKDDVTVTVEVYNVAYLDSKGHNNIFFLGNEYWNPVCSRTDCSLPTATLPHGSWA